ncbi:MAG: hypothetical protein AB8G99_16740 [Planctomycetaceae bacterium]
MPHSAPELIVPSSQSRLVDAVERLDEKLGSLDEWIARTESNLDDFQVRWQVCSENITAQLCQVEQELVVAPQQPKLRIF